MAGLTVGLFSNIFHEVIRGFSGFLLPFIAVQLLPALVTYLFVKYGHFYTAAGALWTISILALVNAFAGAVIVTIVFGDITDEPVDTIIRAMIITGNYIFISAFLGRILINIVDKGIAVLITFLMYRYFYSRFRTKSSYTGR